MSRTCATSTQECQHHVLQHVPRIWGEGQEMVEEEGSKRKQRKRGLRCVLHMYRLHIRNVNIIYYTQALIKVQKIRNNNKRVIGRADCPLCLALAALLQTAHPPRDLSPAQLSPAPIPLSPEHRAGKGQREAILGRNSPASDTRQKLPPTSHYHQPLSNTGPA